MDIGSAWANYVKRLGKLDSEATKKVGEYIGSIPGFSFTNPEDMNKLVGYAYGISAKYGEGAAALACEMYDAIGIASGQILPPAEPADLPDMDEVAKTVRGTAKTGNPKNVSRSVGRLVKRTGADTTLKNAIRDGAEFAWIPNGDTCAFCITLASRGWQQASPKALKNGHAEHIHANCDCTYGVRFDGKPSYKNYNPDEYLEQYESAEGRNSKDTINALRRIKYQENRDRINAQKRAAYAERKRYVTLNKKGDPIYDLFGAIKDSHPSEMNRIIASAKEKGVEIREGNGERMAYSPGLSRGEPGQLIVSDNDSIGAWLHEEQHMIDDFDAGFMGFEGIIDIENRSRMEYNAYKREIDLAMANGRKDIAEQLKELCRDEIESFGGIWDESRLG